MPLIICVIIFAAIIETALQKKAKREKLQDDFYINRFKERMNNE